MIVTLNEDVLKEELLEDESEGPEHFDNDTERFKSEPAFDVIYHFEKDDKPPLSKVIGHENQKQELLLVIDWFKRSKELKEKGISVPKGVLLFGRPGNGKSLLIKEIIKCVDAPVFIFRGEQSNIVKGIVDMFKKAREVGHAVIVFDELDLLIDKDSRIARALQENLDGVESEDDILVLAATNNLDDIPKPLLRNGRLEKIIRVPFPTAEEAFALLKLHFDNFKIDLPKDIDVEEVSMTLSGITCAGIKSVVNDIVLRNGFSNITSEKIDSSIYNILDIVKDSEPIINYDVAIHEAGHAVVAHQFQQHFKVNRLKLESKSGSFTAQEVEKEFWLYDKVMADIKISMAGVLAQKIILGRASRGCENDLEWARANAYNLFNKSGYSSCWETLPNIARDTRRETDIKLRKNEKKIENLLKKCEKETKVIIKKNKLIIKKLADELYQKKRLKSSEILSIIA